MIAGGARWVGGMGDFVTAPFAVVRTETDPLTIHAGPDYATEVVALASKGATLTVLEWDAGFDDSAHCVGGMARVAFGGTQGFACQDYLEATGNPPPAPRARVAPLPEAPLIEAPSGTSPRTAVLVAGLAAASVGVGIILAKRRAAR